MIRCARRIILLNRPKPQLNRWGFSHSWGAQMETLLAPDKEQLLNEIRDELLHALASHIKNEHDLPRRAALLVLTDSLLDARNAKA